MIPVPFQESTHLFGPPKGMKEEDCQTMEVYTHGMFCITCWELTPEEMEILRTTGKVWVVIYSGHSQPPMFLTAQKPFNKKGPVVPGLVPGA